MLEFASSVINVWEKKLFNKLDQERMLKAPNYEQAFLTLFDSDLGDVAEKQEKDIEDVLAKDMASLRGKLLKVLSEKPEIFSFFFLKFDAFNLKLALKQKEKESSLRPFDFAIESYQTIQKQLILPEDSCLDDYCNSYVKEMIRTAKSILKEKAKLDSVAIEQAVDRAYLQSKLNLAKKISPFIQELTRLEIDIANIRNLLQKAKEEFLQGGNLKLADLEKLISSKEGQVVQDLKRFLEFLVLGPAIEAFNKDHSTIALEKKLKAALSEMIFRKEKETGGGAEKATAFWQKKLNGYANIRLILFAKKQHLPLIEIESILLPI